VYATRPVATRAFATRPPHFGRSVVHHPRLHSRRRDRPQTTWRSTARERWLAPAVLGDGELERLVVCGAQRDLTLRRVAERVNNANNEGPDLVDAVGTA